MATFQSTLRYLAALPRSKKLRGRGITAAEARAIITAGSTTGGVSDGINSTTSPDLTRPGGSRGGGTGGGVVVNPSGLTMEQTTLTGNFSNKIATTAPVNVHIFTTAAAATPGDIYYRVDDTGKGIETLRVDMDGNILPVEFTPGTILCDSATGRVLVTSDTPTQAHQAGGVTLIEIPAPAPPSNSTPVVPTCFRIIDTTTSSANSANDVPFFAMKSAITTSNGRQQLRIWWRSDPNTQQSVRVTNPQFTVNGLYLDIVNYELWVAGTDKIMMKL